MSAPILDPRRADAILRELLVRRGGYVPTFAPQPGGPGQALLQIAADQLATLIERLNAAPTKRGFALLDSLGVGLLPAQAARAPVVFEPTPGLAEVTAPAGTRVGARLPGSPVPLVFETETTIAIVGARLAEVTSVAPGRDAYSEHGAALGSGQPVTLFASPTAFAHELYLGHATAFAFSGRATVEIDLALRVGASTPLRLRAAWWDGQVWQAFAPFADPAGEDDSFDGTGGLTRGGTVRLVSPCAQSVLTAVNGTTSHWVRLAVVDPLAPRAPQVLPEADRLQVRSIIERRPLVPRYSTEVGAGPTIVRVWRPDGTHQAGMGVAVRDLVAGTTSTATTGADGSASVSLATGHTYRLGLPTAPSTGDPLAPFIQPAGRLVVDLSLQRGLEPDKAIADGKTIDLTRSFQPFGPAPAAGAALYLACDDAFSKPGAHVTLVLRRPKTALEEADEQGSGYEVQVNAARAFMQSIEDQLTAIAATLDAVRSATGPLGKPLPDLVKAGQSTSGWYSAFKQAIANLETIADVNLQDLILVTTDIVAELVALLLNPAGLVALVMGFGDGPKKDAKKHALEALISLGRALDLLGATHPELKTAIGEGTDAIAADTLQAIEGAITKLKRVISEIANNTGLYFGSLPGFLAMTPEDFVTEVKSRLGAAAQVALQAATDIRAIIKLLQDFSPADLVAAIGVPPPTLAGAQVAWEYWDGARWATLQAPGPGAIAANFQATGSVTFAVREDWETCEVDGDRRRWLRARLHAGSYAHLRLVAWTDSKSNIVNFLPVVEPRPPVLDGLELFFRYASPTEGPQQAASLNDSSWLDLSPALAWPGPGIVPFSACRDDAPALYLGFDAPLAAGRLGLFFDVAEQADATPYAIRYEAWDGAGFVPLAVEDGTRGLTTSGIVHLLWPGDASGFESLVARAADTTVQLAETGAAMRFAPGATLWLSDLRGGELVDIADRSDRTLTLGRSISRPYGAAVIRAAPPARFGTPRTWLRLRFDADAEPPPIGLAAVLPNAVMAANVETIQGEVLGGSDGSPGQVVVSRRSPILVGETVEVRELDGARAGVDAPILRDELAAGGRAADMRVVADPITGRAAEVWVRWHGRDTLAFSTADDRDYTIDRAGGRILFGDGRFGRIPPASPDNLRITYRAAGGEAGDVAAGAITDLLSGVLARGVRNVLPAQGGAAGESLDRLGRRGPGVLRHRRQAVSAADYEALAMEASAAVAVARALGAVDASGRQSAGQVRLVVVPRSSEPAPQPTRELRRQVRDLILARAPLTLGDALVVVGPRYAEVGVDVTVRPLTPDQASAVREGVRARILAFLHPLTGGPEGTGYAFGSKVAASDLARVLRDVAGVDAITELAFLVDGIPQGERVGLAADRLPSAGPIGISLTEAS